MYVRIDLDPATYNALVRSAHRSSRPVKNQVEALLRIALNLSVDHDNPLAPDADNESLASAPMNSKERVR